MFNLDAFKDVANLQNDKLDLENRLNTTKSELNSCKLNFASQMQEAKRFSTFQIPPSKDSNLENVRSDEAELESFEGMKILTLTIDSAENIAPTTGSLLGLNSYIYVLANFQTKDESGKNACVCVNRSNIIAHSTNVDFQEELKLYISKDGILVLNLYHSQVMTGDQCLGQIVIDISEHMKDMISDNGKHVVMRLPFQRCIQNIFDDTGEEVVLEDIIESIPGDISDLGYLNISLEIPNPLYTTCGWVSQIKDDIYQGESFSVEVWLVLHLNSFQIYESPYRGEKALIKSYDLSSLTKMTDVIYNKDEISVDAVELTFLVQSPSQYESIMICFGGAIDLKVFWQKKMLAQLKMAYGNITV